MRLARIISFLFLFSCIAGCSPEEQLDPATPLLKRPSLIGTFEAGTVYLDWTGQSDGLMQEIPNRSIQTERYILEQSRTSPLDLIEIQRFDAVVKRFTAVELTNDQPYYFAIRAEGKGESVRSNVVMIIPQALPAVYMPVIPDSLRPASDWSEQAAVFVNQLQIFNAVPPSSSLVDQLILDSLQFEGAKQFRRSPNGESLLFEQAIALSNGALWGHIGIYNTTTHTAFALTNTEQFFDHQPVWSPDGAWVAYLSDEQMGHEYHIWKARADGSERFSLSEDQNDLNELVSISLRSPSALCFSPIGDAIAFERQQPLGDGYVYSLFEIASSGGSFHELLDAPWNDRKPAYSPSGDQIAFLSDRSGRPEVWVLDSRSGDLVQISGGRAMPSPNLGTGVAWTPDGQQLLYLSGEALAVVLVDVP